MEDDQKPKHVRRERYKGSHPKEFTEKYKEQQPELYSEDIAKVMQQGRTPAGMHRSICVKEIMEILKVTPGETGLDATLGYGGHSLEILKALNKEGRLFATDVDPFELPRTRERLQNLGYTEEYLVLRQMNFSGIDRVVYESGPLNFVLADLGISSMQIDNPERGFTFKFDGPLDLRMNPKNGKSAANFLKTVSPEHLESILDENSDEPFYQQISDAIITAVDRKIPIETTLQLKDLITKAISSFSPKTSKEDIKKSCQRCFQALRIEVNNELGVLDQFLEKLPDALAAGGRVAILTFHSGEDRRVKKWFQHFYREGAYSAIAPDPIRASAEECFNNPRAKSAKLRWAVKA